MEKHNCEQPLEMIWPLLVLSSVFRNKILFFAKLSEGQSPFLQELALQCPQEDGSQRRVSSWVLSSDSRWSGCVQHPLHPQGAPSLSHRPQAGHRIDFF